MRTVSLQDAPYSSDDDESSSPLHSSPHPIRHTMKVSRALPSTEQDEILRRVLQLDSKANCTTCLRMNTSSGKKDRTNYATCVQRDSSSGEKSSIIDLDVELLHRNKNSSNNKYPSYSTSQYPSIENHSFVRSNSTSNEDTEI